MNANHRHLALNVFEELAKAGIDPIAMAIRILNKARVAQNGCWVIDTVHDSSGYAIIRLYRGHTLLKRLKAHRALYEILHGPIGRTMVMDHKCRNRACCNPSHLRPVTNTQNTVENSLSFSGRNKAKTHCIHGHQLSGENLRIRPSTPRRRVCVACERRNGLARYHRNKRLLPLTAPPKDQP
jgi:hypothetical protein